MPFEPLPLTVLVRTQSRVATPLTRLLDALGIGAGQGGEGLTVCVCDDGEPPAQADACVVLAASEDGVARARSTVGARNPSLDHPGRGLMPPARPHRHRHRRGDGRGGPAAGACACRRGASRPRPRRR